MDGKDGLVNVLDGKDGLVDGKDGLVDDWVCRDNKASAASTSKSDVAAGVAIGVENSFMLDEFDDMG